MRLGTDPESRDTTGDGISDAEGVDDDYDPTLFDIESPEITVTYATFNDPDADVELKDPVDVDWSSGTFSLNDPVDASVRVSGSYEVDFIVTDSAGLDEARVVRDGDVEETVPLSGIRDDGDVKFDVGTVSTTAARSLPFASRHVSATPPRNPVSRSPITSGFRWGRQIGTTDSPCDFDGDGPTTRMY